jgi:tetratricopeptide (TPR) repeat protein
MGRGKRFVQSTNAFFRRAAAVAGLFQASSDPLATGFKKAGRMKPHNSFSVLILLLSITRAAPVAAEANSPPSYAEARRASWILTTELIEILKQGDATQLPGTHAWLKDFREQTKGIDKDTPVAKWPEVDIGALVDHNPNFWRMYFEIAPADPMLTLIHAGLLLSQGEAKRTAYIVELGRHRPGIPKKLIQALDMLQNTAMAALKASNAATQEGVKLFDQGDYDAAMKKYREAHKLCPTNGWTYYEMGYTLRTKAQVARGEEPKKPGTLEINGKSQDTPEVIAAFAGARRHDPLLFEAYQGSDPDVIKGALAMAKQVMPAWKALREEGIEKGAEYHALKDLSEGLGEAGVYDLAIFARQLITARRNSYDAADYPIFSAGLRKLAPGAAVEETLARLAGKTMKFRPLTKLEDEEGQPAPGSGVRLYLPDKPPPKEDANKPVRVDHVRFITSEDELDKRVTAEDLIKFDKAFSKVAEEVLGKCKTPCKVLVEFTCAPLGHTVKIMHQPKDIDEEPLKDMYEALAKIDKLPVKEETVQFQVQFTVTPKNKYPDQDKK